MLIFRLVDYDRKVHIDDRSEYVVMCLNNYYRVHYYQDSILESKIIFNYNVQEFYDMDLPEILIRSKPTATSREYCYSRYRLLQTERPIAKNTKLTEVFKKYHPEDFI